MERSQKHKVLEAGFGGSRFILISRSKNGGINLQGAIPRTGGTPLAGSVKGSIVIVERGDCRFGTKLWNAKMKCVGSGCHQYFQRGHFQITSNVTTNHLTVPMGAVSPQHRPRALGNDGTGALDGG
ncbi:hypothetical protein BSKO_09099 [Bryopsis sp. KO-2023]|nr:hypothetical protein BSKO_09099 [Bryopsis sp. KO-2023]